MAVTHADLAPRRRGIDLRSKTGAVLMIVSVLFGLICFIFCLIAEATRSKVLIILTNLCTKSCQDQTQPIQQGSMVNFTNDLQCVCITLLVFRRHG